MLGLRSHRRPRLAAAPTPPGPPRRSEVAPPGPAVAPIHVVLLDDLAHLGPGIGLLTAGHLACVDDASSGIQMVAVPPCSPDRLRELRAQHPGAALVVVDRREAAGSATIAEALEAGADSWVSSGDTRVVAAHLVAVARRTAAAFPHAS
ncbi:MAG: hypothetical protein JWM05_1835 [Acidimicrobiales bacterium]|nr:hypothetical protein [Acidimicrobiales bacterium]